MIVRLDARRLVDAAGMHAALAEAFGFGPAYGKNLDALVDCLTNLDNPKTAMSRIQSLPGQIVLLAVERLDSTPQAQSQVNQLADAIAFVNWRRLERGQSPLLAIAYHQ